MSLPTPYYDVDGITIYHGDCREILPLLPKVDLVLTDPPYELSDSSPGRSHYGMSLRKFESLDYTALVCGFDCEEIFPLTQAVCKPYQIFCFCSNKQISKIMFWGELHGFITTLLVWNKINSAPFANGVWRGDAEYCVHIRESGSYFEGNAELKRKVVQLPIVVNQTHPTEKPLALIKKYILIGCNTKSTILDPFMGSGTTLVAAQQLHRKAIGIEIEEKYCEIAVKRLAQGVLPI